jgi:C4-dicarboxylate-specific signal transduction histidine kinase
MTGYTAHEVLGRRPRKLRGLRTDRAVWEAQMTNRRGNLHDLATGHEITVAPRIKSEIRRQLDARPDADEQAQRLNDQLAHLARLNTLGEMAGRLAHELNQPLTAVANYAQGCSNRLRAGQIDAAELAGVLELIRNAALRAGAIVDRLRSFVRRSGPQQIAVDLNLLIRRQLETIEPDVRESRVQIELDVPSDLPRVLADVFQLEQVVVNLVRNALESMSETPGLERRLAIRARQSGDNEIEVSFCDRGRGVQDEVAARLFEPFYSTKAFGLGMGLPISRSILEWHGGRLWWEANGQCGACFRFTLPITQGETSDGDGD